MSYFEGRREFGEAAHKVIERSTAELSSLAAELQRPDATAGERQQAIARTLEASAFTVEWGVAGVEQAFTAEKHRWNSEDMRKGMRHGHVAFLVAGNPPVVPDGLGWHPLDAVAATAAAIGLGSTLTKMYGTVSMIAVPSVADVPALVDAGIFEFPDCVFLMRADDGGQGFQHTTNSTGSHLAHLAIDLSTAEGSTQLIHELHAAVESIIDEFEEPDSIAPTSSGFVIKARSTATIDSVADQITALARARAGSSDTEIKIERSRLIPEFQANRILARRIKTFNDTYKFPQDRIRKEPPAEPTRWGAVTQVAGTAKVRFPVSSLDGEISADDITAAQTIAKAASSAGLDVLGDMEFRGFVEGEMVRSLREHGIVRTPRRWLGVHPVIPRKDIQPKARIFPDVVVRGPGLPDPTLQDKPGDDES